MRGCFRTMPAPQLCPSGALLAVSVQLWPLALQVTFPWWQALAGVQSAPLEQTMTAVVSFLVLSARLTALT